MSEWTIVLYTHTQQFLHSHHKGTRRQTGKGAGITRPDILAVCWMLAKKPKPPTADCEVWELLLLQQRWGGRARPSSPRCSASVCPPGSLSPDPAKILAGNRCLMQILQSNEGKVPPLSATFQLGGILIWPESSFGHVWVWLWARLTDPAWGAEALQNWKSNSLCVDVWSAASGAGSAEWHLTSVQVCAPGRTMMALALFHYYWLYD